MFNGQVNFTNIQFDLFETKYVVSISKKYNFNIIFIVCFFYTVNNINIIYDINNII